MKHLLALITLALTLPLFAATEIVNGITWTYTISSGKATIGSDSYNTPAIPETTSGAIIVPEQLNGCDVTSIGSNAFEGCSSLTSIAIPDSVTSIGNFAFSGCSSLTLISIPEGVTSIGTWCFSGCSSLTSVTIPDSVTLIDSSAFNDCSSLTTIVIPKGVTSIGEGVFRGCSLLTSITIPEGVTSIGDDLFFGCSSLTSVTIPDSVTLIGSSAFNDCSSLTTIVIPEDVTSIGDRAFFACSSLTSIAIPKGVTSIGNSTFHACSSLISVNIPEGVTTIGSSAFWNCRSLTTITIPKGVTSIGYGAFAMCDSLKDVYALGAPPEGWDGTSGVLHFPQKYAAAWQAVLEESQRGMLIDVISDAKVEVSAEMTTPKTMAVRYTVASVLPEVKVRAVAFKDGVRSFANVVPVKTGTNVPNGGSVATNVEHSFVWQVDADWSIDLAKVKMEILVQEGTLLPQELLTIPANGDHVAMTITRNALNEPLLFDALLWCMAEGDDALVNTDGVVQINGQTIANGTAVATWDGRGNGSQNYEYRYVTTLLNYLYGKMGYKVLAGDDYTYAKAMTRIDFANSGIRQVAVKMDETASVEE